RCRLDGGVERGNVAGPVAAVCRAVRAGRAGRPDVEDFSEHSGPGWLPLHAEHATLTPLECHDPRSPGARPDRVEEGLRNGTRVDGSDARVNEQTELGLTVLRLAL